MFIKKSSVTIKKLGKHVFVILLLIGHSESLTTVRGQDTVVSNNAQIDLPSTASSVESLKDACAAKGFDISKLLEDERFKIYDNIKKYFTRSAERKSVSLTQYKKILGYNQKKDQAGTFIKKYQTTLEKAEKEYGVSRYVIAAILGIESDFGKNIGGHNPFNAYASMYIVDYRSDFALEQLIQLLSFAKRNEVDVFDLKSSYAGAISYAQFIPYSLNKWFVGGDIFDMGNNIMSIGNYLAYFMGKTGDMRTAVLRYNPSGLYADAVMSLAKDIEN